MFSKSKLKIFFSFDATLWLILAFSLIIGYLKIIPAEPKHLILVIIAYGATVPIVIGAIRALINKKISIYLLAGIALCASLIAKQWNSVIFISLMITSARIFGDYTEDKSRTAIESLLELKPQKARVEKNGKIVEVPVEELKKGDIVIVELGEKIPVDGIVEKGEAEINQSALTGESLPISKKPGDQVLSSGIVESGNLTIKTVKIGKETTFEKFIALVEQSQKNKAGIMRLSDKFAAWYIILTIIASSAIYIFTHNVYLVLGVLLVSCADDVAVALPLAFLTSMGHAAKHGAVIKGANYLEALSKVKVVVMDKTGTLTKGRLKIENIFSFGDAKAEKIMEAAATVSVMSDHPSSRAIIRYAKEKNIPVAEPEKFNEYAGKGATADYKNQKIASGKIAFFEELKIKIAASELEAINREKDKGLGINLIARDDKMLGFLTFADEIRPEVKAIITELENLGVEKIVMLTGDNEKIAKRVANQVGIKYYHANLLPEDKLRYLKSYLSKNYKTAMIGDGVNDAAALALADVGIAMGAIGSDAAIEAADIALMRDEINQVPELIRIGKSTMKIVYQDLLIWGCVNVLGLILVFGRMLGPSGAAAYNFVTDFFPLINSLRLFM